MIKRFFLALATLSLLACEAPELVDAMPETPDGQERLNALAGFQRSQEARRLAQRFLDVVDAVEPVAEQVCRERTTRMNCDFRIVIDDRPGQPPNAFQTVDATGRPILAFNLAMVATARNADELAFVMGHEAAHHIAGHLARRQVAANAGSDIFAGIARRSGVDAQGQEIAAQLGAAVGARSYSQEFELEADILGTQIAARAGFNPLIGSEFFFRIPDPGNRFLGTHPPNAQRAAAVRAEARRLGF